MTRKKTTSQEFVFPSLSTQIRAWRIYGGLTQTELQERAGMAHNAISRIETGEVSPRLETLERLASALNISIEELQFRKPPDAHEVNIPTDVSFLIDRLDALPVEKRQELIQMFDAILRMVEK